MSTVGLRLSAERRRHPHRRGPRLSRWRIQRHQKRGTTRHYVYNYPAKKALRSIKAKCKTICRMNVSLPLAVLLHQLNSVLRGWTAYFRAGVSARAFRIPAHDRLASGIRMAAAQASELGVEETPPPLLRRQMVAARRRGRAVQPWFGSHHPLPAQGIDDPFALAIGKLIDDEYSTGLVESRMRGQLARPVREGGMKKRTGSNPETALHADPTTTSSDGRRRARLASRRLPEGLAGIRGFHELVACHAEEPSQVVIGIETDRGLWVEALGAAGYQVLRSIRWRGPLPRPPPGLGREIRCRGRQTAGRSGPHRPAQPPPDRRRQPRTSRRSRSSPGGIRT